MGFSSFNLTNSFTHFVWFSTLHDSNVDSLVQTKYIRETRTWNVYAFLTFLRLLATSEAPLMSQQRAKKFITSQQSIKMHLTYKAPIDLWLPIRFPHSRDAELRVICWSLSEIDFNSRIPLLISHFMMPSSPISVIALEASKMCLCELLYGGLCVGSVSDV